MKISIVCYNDNIGVIDFLQEIMRYAKDHYFNTIVLGSRFKIHRKKGGADNGRRNVESRSIPGDGQR